MYVICNFQFLSKKTTRTELIRVANKLQKKKKYQIKLSKSRIEAQFKISKPLFHIHKVAIEVLVSS